VVRARCSISAVRACPGPVVRPCRWCVGRAPQHDAGAPLEGESLLLRTGASPRWRVLNLGRHLLADGIQGHAGTSAACSRPAILGR